MVLTISGLGQLCSGFCLNRFPSKLGDVQSRPADRNVHLTACLEGRGWTLDGSGQERQASLIRLSGSAEISVYERKPKPSTL